MDPKCVFLLDGTQQKRFEIEENFVRSVAILGRLMRQDREQILVATSASNQSHRSGGMWIVRIGRHIDLEQFDMLPNAFGIDACAQLQFGADRNGLVNGQFIVRSAT